MINIPKLSCITPSRRPNRQQEMSDSIICLRLFKYLGLEFVYALLT